MQVSKEENSLQEMEQNEIRPMIEHVKDKDDYLNKKKNMEKFSYKNTWNNINEKIVNTINEN